MTSNFKGIVDANEITSLLSDLIQIESINPDFSKGKDGERRISKYVYNYMTDIGVESRQEEVLPGRSNVVCYLEGRDKRGLCFESHMDTVTIDNMTIDPFNPVIEEGKLYGRGSCDDKGSLAAMMYAIKMLKKNNIKPSTDIYFIAAVDEEYKYRGVTHFLKKYKDLSFHGAVVGEPTELNIVTACKGVVRWKITTIGKSGHSSNPEKGQNAIYDMASIIDAINKDLIPSYKDKKHKLLGNPSLSVGKIQGGVLVNVIPDRCTIEIDRRTLPGENWESIKKEVLRTINNVKKINNRINAKISEPSVTDYAMDTNINSNIVQVCDKSLKKIIGKSKIKGVNFSCDASKFAKENIPSIVLGPGNILQAHSEDEYVNIEELCRAAEVYAQICIDF